MVGKSLFESEKQEFRPYFKENRKIYAKSVNRGILLEIFLGKKSLFYIIEGIDKIGKVEGTKKDLRIISDSS